MIDNFILLHNRILFIVSTDTLFSILESGFLNFIKWKYSEIFFTKFRIASL